MRIFFPLDHSALCKRNCLSSVPTEERRTGLGSLQRIRILALWQDIWRYYHWYTREGLARRMHGMICRDTEHVPFEGPPSAKRTTAGPSGVPLPRNSLPCHRMWLCFNCPLHQEPKSPCIQDYQPAPSYQPRSLQSRPGKEHWLCAQYSARHTHGCESGGCGTGWSPHGSMGRCSTAELGRY